MSHGASLGEGRQALGGVSLVNCMKDGLIGVYRLCLSVPITTVRDPRTWDALSGTV